MQDTGGHSLMEFTAGMRIGLDGRYEIVRICGRGGMGVVYEALDHGLDRPRQVAIKQLHKIIAQNPRFIRNVRREVGIARDLRHPNIVGVYEYVKWRDEHLVIMEWVDGPTLDQALLEQPEECYSPEQALEIIKPIASALDYAHQQDPPVVHRDLKPLNIMLTGKGTIKVTDFGLSREMKESLTRVTGKDSSGSLEYMPFEQYMGDPPHPSHDIYALGITVYELLNGQPPFTRGDIGMQHREKIPPMIEGISEPVMDVLLKTLAKDPKDRYATAGDLVDKLKSAINGKDKRGEKQYKEDEEAKGEFEDEQKMSQAKYPSEEKKEKPETDKEEKTQYDVEEAFRTWKMRWMRIVYALYLMAVFLDLIAIFIYIPTLLPAFINSTVLLLAVSLWFSIRNVRQYVKFSSRRKTLFWFSLAGFSLVIFSIHLIMLAAVFAMLHH